MTQSVSIQNSEVLEILDNTSKMDLFSNSVVRNRGFDVTEYDLMSEYAVSKSYLNKRLERDYPKIEYSHNLVIGDTEGGLYCLKELSRILNYDGFYTSGYNPKGFVGWHSDTDIYGYYVMLSYSTTGDGYFRYYENNMIHTVSDKQGWMIKVMTLGSTSQDAVWHCAVTKCARYTFLLRFDSIQKYEQALNILQVKYD